MSQLIAPFKVGVLTDDDGAVNLNLMVLRSLSIFGTSPAFPYYD